MKSNHISSDFGGGHHHHHQGKSTSTSQDTAIINYLILHTQAYPLRVVPLYVLMGDVKWIGLCWYLCTIKAALSIRMSFKCSNFHHIFVFILGYSCFVWQWNYYTWEDIFDFWKNYNLNMGGNEKLLYSLLVFALQAF